MWKWLNGFAGIFKPDGWLWYFNYQLNSSSSSSEEKRYFCALNTELISYYLPFTYHCGTVLLCHCSESRIYKLCFGYIRTRNNIASIFQHSRTKVLECWYLIVHTSINILHTSKILGLKSSGFVLSIRDYLCTGCTIAP